MIAYQRLWDLMKEKGVSTYTLIHTYGISSNQINRWKHGADMKLSTLNSLCGILECEPSDILTYTRDDVFSIQLRDREVMLVSETKADTPRRVPVEKSAKNPSHPLGDKLNRIMKERGIPARLLSKQSGIPLPTIRNIQYGRTTNPRTETLISLAQALGVSLEELMEK